MKKLSKLQLGNIGDITLMLGNEAKALSIAYKHGDIEKLTAQISKLCVDYTNNTINKKPMKK